MTKQTRIKLLRPTDADPVGEPVRGYRRRLEGRWVVLVEDSDAPRTPGVVNS